MTTTNPFELKERLDAAEEKVKHLKWKKKELIKNKKDKIAKRKEERTNLKNYLEAREVINKALDITQAKLKSRIDSLVTLAINSVFDREFKFELLIEKKYNRMVCTPIVTEGDRQYRPKEDMGGGIIDIISFAFRVVLWSLEHPRSRNTFILDEPMRFVGKGELLDRAGNILSEMSHRLGFQLLVVTHEKELSEVGDKAYQIEHIKGISKAKVIRK